MSTGLVWPAWQFIGEMSVKGDVSWLANVGVIVAKTAAANARKRNPAATHAPAASRVPLELHTPASS